MSEKTETKNIENEKIKVYEELLDEIYDRLYNAIKITEQVIKDLRYNKYILNIEIDENIIKVLRNAYCSIAHQTDKVHKLMNYYLEEKDEKIIRDRIQELFNEMEIINDIFINLYEKIEQLDKEKKIDEETYFTFRTAHRQIFVSLVALREALQL